MKQILLTLLLSLTLVLSHSQTRHFESGGRYCSERKSSLRSLPSLKSTENIPPHSFDVLDYKLEAKFYNNFTSPYPHDFKGTNTVTFRVDTALNFINLNADNYSLTINSVGLAGTAFGHTGNILHIQLDRTYNPGEIVQVSINYQHKNVDDGAFYAKNGFIFTDCEPEGARKWLPCYDRPSDKATWELFAKVPASVKLGSNGMLVDSVFNADTLTYHWKSAHEVATYLIVLTAKVNYKLDIIYWPKPSNPTELVPFRFYYNPGEYPYQMEAIIGPMATYFSESFCEHPFEKNGFATLNSDFVWGGMENQTLTSLCPGCWSESLVAHEFAHQWFGDMITCATWADIFLNEGFATWSEARWAENSGGYSAYKYNIDNEASAYFQGIPSAPWPISDSSWAVTTPDLNTLFNYSVTYAKGACAVHLIRYILGDSMFFQVLNAYSNDSALKYNSATIADLNRVVNEVTGENYDWYFRDWLFQKYHPTYDNSYNIEDAGNGTWIVNYFTRQTQMNTGFFRMIQEIKINFTDNTDTTFRIMNSDNNQQFHWTFGKQPESLVFDPDNEIVLKAGNTIVGAGKSGNSVITGLRNQPNPASSQTLITFNLTAGTDVKLELMDITGKVIRVIAEDFLTEGEHNIEMNCSSLASGLYHYRLSAGNSTMVRKMIVTH